MESHPPPLRANKRFKILYATQVTRESGGPVKAPVFMLFVNSSELLTDTYRRYLEGQIRERHGFDGLPIVFLLKSR